MANKSDAMKSKPLIAVLCTVVILAMIIASSVPRAKSEQGRVPVRIGWQLPTATQGQIVEVLKRTELLDRKGMDPIYIPFSYGEPEIAAALEGQLDVMFLSGQSMANLLAKGGKWKIVGRLHNNTAALMVPSDSPIKSPKDLRGKTVASPFGTIGYREAILKEQAAGLNADKDVKNVNVDILRIQKIIEAGGRERWGNVDAAGLWEPDISLYQSNGMARVLTSDRAINLIAVSDKFIADHRKTTVQVLQEIAQAWQYFSRFRDRVNQWYIDDSQFGFTPESLIAAAKQDPNFGAKSPSDVDLQLSADDLRILDKGAAFAHERGYTQNRVPLREAVDPTFAAEAKKDPGAGTADKLQVVLPSAREIALQEESGDFLASIPLWGIFALQVILTLAALELGQWLGVHRASQPEHESESAVSAVSGAVLALLAFVLALTFGAAASRFDARRDALIGDVTAIQTAYMRAGLVPEPHTTITRSLLRDYVEVRLNMADTYGKPEQLRALRARSATITNTIWSHAETLALKDSNDINALFAEGITDLVDYQNKRVAFGAHFRIPTFVWMILVLASCISMFIMGFQFGLSGKRSFPSQLALVLTFALVIQLIYDLDSPGKGYIRLNQQPMIDLYQSLCK